MKVKIGDIKEPASSIELVGKIVSLKEAKSNRNGSESVYHYGILGDETGTIPFTAWNLPSSIREGDVVELKNCTSRIYNDRIRITIGSNTEVVLRPEEQMEVKRIYKEYRIKDLTTSDPYVTVSGIVRGVSERETEIRGEKVRLFNAFLDDGTASIRLSSFGVPVSEGEQIKITGGKVSEFNGRISLTMGQKTAVEKTRVNLDNESRQHLLWDMVSPVGNVSFTGIPVNIGDRSGVVDKCSVCGKFMGDSGCADHPGAATVKDVSCYFTLEDGTGSISCFMDGDVLKAYAGIEGNIEALDPVEVRQSILKSLESNVVKVEGNMSQKGESFRLKVLAISRAEDSDVTAELQKEQ